MTRVIFSIWQIKLNVSFGKILGQSLSNSKTVIQQNLKLAPNNDFKLETQEVDQLGFTHQRFQQTDKGVPVAFAMPAVHAKDGKVARISGDEFIILLDALPIKMFVLKKFFVFGTANFVADDTDVLEVWSSGCIYVYIYI